MYKHADGANCMCTPFYKNVNDNFMFISPPLICNEDQFQHRPTQQIHIMYFYIH